MDVEALVVSYLSQAMDCLVCTDVPNPRPTKVVTVERTGGTSWAGVDRPSLAIQCWAETRVDSASLAYAVREALSDIDALNEIGGISVDSLYNFPSEKGEPRYQLVANLVSYF